MRAHVAHMHMWRHGSTVVSRASLMQITHSFADSSAAVEVAPTATCSTRGLCV
jgi:hypothetical protein